ncbi:MAG: radical SAM protein [Desulfobulbales bacterium]
MPRNALHLLQKAVEQEKLVRADTGDIIHIAPEKHSNVLVIAPHAVPHDDDNTGLIGSRIAEILDGHAVINEKYQKPETLGHDEPDIEKDLVNLNRWDQINRYQDVQDEFIAPIEESRDSIKKKYKKSVLVHIHGISDENLRCVNRELAKNTGINNELHLLIGCGQSDATDRSAHKSKLTAKSGMILKFITVLGKEGISAAIAPIRAVKGADGIPKLYCGNDLNGLNQKLSKPKSRVQSIQLEIGYTGLRDTDVNALATADRIAKALSGFAEGIDTEKVESLSVNATNPEPGNDAVEEADKVLRDKIEPESSPDMKLVDYAYVRLAGIYSGHYEKAMLDAGQYIVDTFYSGDIERARNNDSPLKESLHSLLERISRDKAEGLPSKSWVYNSVKLVVAEHDFMDFHTYGKLGLSQKILLFPVRDNEIKKRLINEVVANDYTVACLRERIAEETGNNSLAAEDPLKLIKNPGNLFNSKYSFWQPPHLATLPAEKKEALITRSKDRIREILSVIAAEYENLDKYEAFAMTLKHSGKGNIEEDISGTREWAPDTENNSTGCSNKCLYCFACADALSRKQIASREEWATCRVRVHDVLKRHHRHSGTVMFPSTHDILSENIYACLITLENLLRAGNQVLIVSKPRPEIIEILCKHLKRYKSSILFRFTIGALDNELLSFWEPGAPRYEERKQALQYAYDKKFSTSVSVEPMLDADHIDELVDDLLPLVTDAIWIGKMNRIRHCVDITDDTVETAVQEIEAGQTDENIKAIYARHKDNPKIKWKESIKKVLGLKSPERPGMDK